MAVKSKGSYTVKKLRMRRRTRPEGDSYIIPFVGPYDQLTSQQPALGSTVSGLPNDYLVEEVNIEEGQGGSGRMIVTATKRTPGPPSGSSSYAQIGETLYELDWYEERRPIEEHPKCGFLKTDRLRYLNPEQGSETEGQAANPHDSKKGRPRTWAHWEVLDESDYEQKNNGWSLAEYRFLKEAGTDTFPVAYPVARKTIYSRGRLTAATNVWKKDTPPPDVGAPSGFVYVKSASRITKQGRIWSKVEEWRGYANAQDLFFT